MFSIFLRDGFCPDHPPFLASSLALVAVDMFFQGFPQLICLTKQERGEQGVNMLTTRDYWLGSVCKC